MSIFATTNIVIIYNELKKKSVCRSQQPSAQSRYPLVTTWLTVIIIKNAKIF